MKYFYDTEFLEGTQKKWFGRNTPPTIDLISIGIVAEDGREYYAISKEFNLKEAWNRFDIKVKETYGDMRNIHPNGIKSKVYWIRENVLKPIFYQLNEIDLKGQVLCLREHGYPIAHPLTQDQINFSFRRMVYLINKYGKTRDQIAGEVKKFCDWWHTLNRGWSLNNRPIEFYGYYSAYDHVALCWLFGKMLDLPKGFPMYTRDLKQELDRRATGFAHAKMSLDEAIQTYKESDNYPKQENEHHALADARWNKKLYDFLQSF